MREILFLSGEQVSCTRQLGGKEKDDLSSFHLLNVGFLDISTLLVLINFPTFMENTTTS